MTGQLDNGRRSDILRLARGGTLNLIGAVSEGVFNLALVLVVTRILPIARAGVFFQATALFLILSNAAVLGADTGLLRAVPRCFALRRTNELRTTLLVATAPVLALASVAAVALLAAAPRLAELLTESSQQDYLRQLLIVVAPFLPAATLAPVVLAATRGLGTMVPSVVVRSMVVPALQVSLMLVAAGIGLGGLGVALAWALPLGLSVGPASRWLQLLLRRAPQRVDQTLPARGTGDISREFWGFASPRALAGVFYIGIDKLDILLVGALASARAATIYTAATRLALIGKFANRAVVQVIAPKISELMARDDRARSQTLYQVCTGWLITLVWPLYITMALFATTILTVFGAEFAEGAAVLVILGGALVVATGAGPVDAILLMAGKSSWSMLNALLGLVLNVVLNLLLIPRSGITGAAIAWAVSLMAVNLLPLLQLWRLRGLHPFGPGFFTVARAALLTYGAVGLLVRSLLGSSLLVLFLFGVVSTAGYVAILWRHRENLELVTFWEALRRRTPPARAVT